MRFSIFEKMNGDGDNAGQRRITNRRIFDHLRNAGKSPAERSYVSDIRATVLDLLNIAEDTLSDEASGQLTAKAVYLAKYIRKKWSGSQRTLRKFYRLAGDHLDNDFQFPAEQPQNEVPQVPQVPHVQPVPQVPQVPQVQQVPLQLALMPLAPAPQAQRPPVPIQGPLQMPRIQVFQLPENPVPVVQLLHQGPGHLVQVHGVQRAQNQVPQNQARQEVPQNQVHQEVPQNQANRNLQLPRQIVRRKRTYKKSWDNLSRSGRKKQIREIKSRYQDKAIAATFKSVLYCKGNRRGAKYIVDQLLEDDEFTSKTLKKLKAPSPKKMTVSTALAVNLDQGKSRSKYNDDKNVLKEHNVFIHPGWKKVQVC